MLLPSPGVVLPVSRMTSLLSLHATSVTRPAAAPAKQPNMAPETARAIQQRGEAYWKREIKTGAGSYSTQYGMVHSDEGGRGGATGGRECAGSAGGSTLGGDRSLPWRAIGAGLPMQTLLPGLLSLEKERNQKKTGKKGGEE